MGYNAKCCVKPGGTLCFLKKRMVDFYLIARKREEAKIPKNIGKEPDYLHSIKYIFSRFGF